MGELDTANPDDANALAAGMMQFLNNANAATLAGSLLPSPDSRDALAMDHKAPFVGGRSGQRMYRGLGRRVLAFLGTIDDLENGRNIKGLMNANEPDALYGSTALQLVSTPGLEAVLAPKTANAVPTDVTGGIIALWFKPIANVYDNIDKFSIQLHSAGSPSAPTENYHWIEPFGIGPYDLKARLTSKNGTGRWQRYSIAVPQFVPAGSGADLSNITFARLLYRSRHDDGGQPTTIQFASIEFIPNGLRKAKAIIGFDDAFAEHYTVAAAQMARYGFPGVLYPSPAALRVGAGKSYISVEQLHSLHDNLGWQIASQAWTTEDKRIVDGWSENEFTAELAKLRNWHNSMGVTGGEHGSYFSGVTPDDMIAYPSFRKHFRSMRAFYSGNSAGPPLSIGETYPFGDPMTVRALNGASWNDASNTTQLQAHIDQAIANTGVAFVIYHNEVATPGPVQEGFLAMLAYLDQKRDEIDVCTEEDLMFDFGR